jgi:OmpA-OmpF porin, OOP family
MGVPIGRSPLEVVRNYENELKAAGYEVLFSGGKEELGGRFAEAAGYDKIKWAVIGGAPGFTGNADAQRFLAAKLSRPTGDVYVTLYAVENNNWAAYLKEFGLEKSQTLLQTDIIVSKPMESKMVTVPAEEMGRKITDTGSVAIYGIYFDFNKADVKLESDPTIEQIAKLLKGDSTLKLLVVGHTDNAGAFAFNMDLSQHRATAVVNALVSRFGIDRDRLVPVGVSFASPVASNKTEEGRAKNRRVELVEN